MSQDSARIQFEVLSLPLDAGKMVSVTFQQCYDVKAPTPVWTRIPHNRCEVEVTENRCIAFQVTLGEGMWASGGPPSRTCHLKLQHRPGEKLADAMQRPVDEQLPTIRCTLTCECYAFSKRIRIHPVWSTIVYADAIRVFDELARLNHSEMVPRMLVVNAMRAEFKRLFSYLARSEKTLASMPVLDDETIDRLFLLNDRSPTLERFSKAPISKQMFCGDSDQSILGIWRSFQMLVEMIGRSKFVRKLYASKQLRMYTPTEQLRIEPDSNHLKHEFGFFFRLPRSSVPSPAIVIELFRFVGDCKKHKIQQILPQAYITSRQLEFSGGNPLTAFANLQSAHAAIFKKMKPSQLLQVVGLFDDKDAKPNSKFAVGDDPSAWDGLDVDWWYSSTSSETLYR